MLNDTKWNSATDLDKLDAPVVGSSSQVNYSGKKGLRVTLAQGFFMVTKAEVANLDAYWDNLAKLERYDLDEEGIGVSEEPGWSITITSIWPRRYRIDYRGVIPTRSPAQSSDDQQKGIYEWAFFQSLEFFGPNVGSNTDSYLFIFIPYTWQDLDAAEMAHMILHYYSGYGVNGRDLLDKDSAFAYSARMQDPVYRVRLNYWAQHGERQSAELAKMLQQAGTLTTFQVHGPVQGEDLIDERLRLVHWRDLDTHSYTIEERRADTPEPPAFNSWLRAPITLRNDPNLLANVTEMVWGRFVGYQQDNTQTVSYVGDQVGAEDDDGRPQNRRRDEGNVIRDKDNASITAYGEIHDPQEHRSPMISQPMDASAVWDASRFRIPPRRITLNQGPMGFDYLVGDLLKVKNEFKGLYEQDQWLVEDRLYDWDDIAVITQAVEFKPEYLQADPAVARASRIEVAPLVNDDPALDLLCWYRGDNVVPLGGLVTAWPDQSGNLNTANHDSQVGGNPQSVLSDPALNGQAWVDFSNNAPGNSGLIINNSLFPNDDSDETKLGMFVQAVVKIITDGGNMSMLAGGNTASGTRWFEMGTVDPPLDPGTTRYGFDVSPVWDFSYGQSEIPFDAISGDVGVWQIVEFWLPGTHSRIITPEAQFWAKEGHQVAQDYNESNISNSVYPWVNTVIGGSWNNLQTRPWLAGIAELIIWRNIPYAPSIQRVRAYLRDRYALPSPF